MKTKYYIFLIQLIITSLLSLGFSGNNILDKVEHGFVNNKGVKIHYAKMGKGPLIVMVHGFPDFWYTWREEMKILSDNYTVVAIDLRGYNKSDKPKGVENYKMKYLIGDVAAVIKHFTRDKAILIGHDWGGGISWQVAMWRPDLIEKLIILSTPHPNGLKREINTNKEQQDYSQYAIDFQKEDAYKNLTSEGLANWVQNADDKKIYIDAFDRSDFEAMLNYYKASFPKKINNFNTPVQNKHPKQRKVLCQTLAIFGLNDKALLPSGWSGTWDWIDNELTLVSIPGAGHFVQHDASEQVKKIIKTWLEK